jgi:hypothetical protein
MDNREVGSQDQSWMELAQDRDRFAAGMLLISLCDSFNVPVNVFSCLHYHSLHYRDK